MLKLQEERRKAINEQHDEMKKAREAGERGDFEARQRHVDKANRALVREENLAAGIKAAERGR